MLADHSLAEALRMTRSGKLSEATALIQATLGARAPAPDASGARPEPIIDLVPESVTVTPASHSERMRADPKRREPGPGVAGGFVEQRYSGPAGALGYKLYTPPGLAAGAPLVVMLHGCTQSPDDFARCTGMNRLADELGFLVAWPEQTQAANPSKCWNWFRPGDQRRDAGEPALIAGITRQVIAEHGVDPNRVYVAGFSAGGAAAAVMAAAYPDVYAAVGIHSGLAGGAARDLPSALAAMKRGNAANLAVRGGARATPVITFHGDRDATVHEINAREIVARALADAGAPLATRSEQGRAPGGRRYTRAVSLDDRGRALIEQWTVHDSGHAWSGGSAASPYTDPAGPDASREMLRFFLEHRTAA